MIFALASIGAGAVLGSAGTKKNDISANSSTELRMKTIGIIGGVSWVSSMEYYRLINEMVGRKLGGLHSAKILMYSEENSQKGIYNA